MTKPLKGLKVIELGQLIAGPFAGKFFSEFGAEVIKIEPPEGDPLRKWRKIHQGTSLWWHVQNRNKKSVTVNLRTPEGQGVVRRIARDVDVVIENFRPGTLEKWGLGYERLAAENPGLVMLRLSGFGQTGPYRDQAGFGAIGESMGGLRYVTGFPDRPPVRPNLSIGDALASLHGVVGVMMALHHRNANGGRSSGRGQVVDVALYEAVFNMMEGALPEYDLFEEVRERTGSNLTGIVPSNTYLTRDAQHVVIGANADSIFKRLMKVIGREDLADDPSLADNAGRAKRGEELDAAIGKWTAKYDADDVVKTLNEAWCRAARSTAWRHRQRRAVSGAGHDPRSQAQGRHADQGAGRRAQALGHAGRHRVDRPELGEHTATVLAAHGYSKTEIAGLRECKAI